MALVVKLLGGLGLGYLALVLAVALGQGALLFPRAATGPAPDLPAGATALALDLPGGDRLHGQMIPAARGDGAERPLVLGFGGNAWNAAAMALYLHQVLPDHEVASFHFRGYAPSTGRPSAAALLADAVAVHDHLQARAGPRPVVAVGFSIGTGPAAHLAARRALAGVVLVTPFDDLTTVARQHYPFLPVRALFRHSMTPADDLATATAPVALISAARDSIIPPARAQALEDALRGSRPDAVVLSRQIDAGHNDIHADPTFRAALRDAIVQFETPGRNGP